MAFAERIPEESEDASLRIVKSDLGEEDSVPNEVDRVSEAETETKKKPQGRLRTDSFEWYEAEYLKILDNERKLARFKVNLIYSPQQVKESFRRNYPGLKF